MDPHGPTGALASSALFEAVAVDPQGGGVFADGSHDGIVEPFLVGGPDFDGHLDVGPSAVSGWS